MPRTGRPPKPVELKRKMGNPGQRRLPTPIISLPAVISASEVPGFESGDAMIQHMLDAGASTWIGPTDTAMADLARQLWNDRAAAREAWRAMPLDKDAFRAYDELSKRLIACLSTLGLDPAARGRLGVAAVKVRSKLEELADRRAVRAGRQGF